MKSMNLFQVAVHLVLPQAVAEGPCLGLGWAAVPGPHLAVTPPEAWSLGISLVCPVGSIQASQGTCLCQGE